MLFCARSNCEREHYQYCRDTAGLITSGHGVWAATGRPWVGGFLGLDGCEVRLCDPCARVSRVCPGSPRCLFTVPGTGLPCCETGGCNHPFSGTTVENLSELNSTYRDISGRG